MASDADTGLVERLRSEACKNGGNGSYAWRARELCGKAADAIERLATLSRPSADFAAVVEQCARVAEMHKPNRKRPLSYYEAEDRDMIRCEENGEAIAASVIAAAIRSIQAPDEGGGL